MDFRVTLIEARSDVPLYLYNAASGNRTVIPMTWQVLWTGPSTPNPNAFAAFDMTRATVALRVTCEFGAGLKGRTLQLQGVLNGIPAVVASVTVTSTNPTLVQGFTPVHLFEGAVSYRGSFLWRLMDSDTPVATFGTETSLEWYTVVKPIDTLWGPSGISTNLLRRNLAVFSGGMINWLLADFFRNTAETIFYSPFQYDNEYGAAAFSQDSLGGIYDLDQYFADLEAGRVVKINCYDMAGIVQITLKLFPAPLGALWSLLTPYGWINPTVLKGWASVGLCNNPFFGNSEYNPTPLAPVDPVSGQKDRSPFANHAFITAPTRGGTIVTFDATSGPHIGNQTLPAFLSNSIDHVTTYYAKYEDSGPGTANEINPDHTGVTSINTALNTSLPLRAHVGAMEVGHPLHPVDKAMERAKVKDADPPSFSLIDPSSLASLLQRKSGSKRTLENVEPRANGSRVTWLFGTRPKAVEVTLFAADSFKAAVQAMRDSLATVSAPLDKVFISTLRLGQRTLQGVGGRGFILFVRGNVFVRLVGLASSEELGKVAVDVDSFLKEKQTGSPPLPKIDQPNIPSRQVAVGEDLEVVIEVVDAAWMTASVDASILQLLEVDTAHATFKFHAGSRGGVDVRFIFAHKHTLQTATATIHVDVVEDEDECEDIQEGLGELEI